jgi:hypothetical protein
MLIVGFKTIRPAWFRHPRLSKRRILIEPTLSDSTRLFLLCSIPEMTDRPASWRMPTPKQMEKLAAAVRKPGPLAAAPDRSLPAEYWESVLNDPRAGATGAPTRQRRLSEIQRHVLRIGCRRCQRTVEIQTADAVRLYGADAVCKQVAERLLDDTCQQRTGSHEDDGCWPGFEMP